MTTYIGRINSAIAIIDSLNEETTDAIPVIGNELWFDATDDATITKIDGAVSQLQDKSNESRKSLFDCLMALNKLKASIYVIFEEKYEKLREYECCEQRLWIMRKHKNNKEWVADSVAKAEEMEEYFDKQSY